MKLAAFAAAAVVLSGLAPVALAQTQQQAPNMPAPGSTTPEKIDPPATGSTETLSEKLNKSDGVIRPPSTAAPDMTVTPPVPNPGTTPVIRPPGTEGGNTRIDPK
jgi:hypothetical protein